MDDVVDDRSASRQQRKDRRMRSEDDESLDVTRSNDRPAGWTVQSPASRLAGAGREYNCTGGTHRFQSELIDNVDRDEDLDR